MSRRKAAAGSPVEQVRSMPGTTPTLSRRTLVDSLGVSVMDLHCRAGVEPLGPEEPNPTHGIVFVRKGVFRRMRRGETFVADPNHVLFFNAGEPYRYAHPLPGGDECTVLAVETHRAPRARRASRAPRRRASGVTLSDRPRALFAAGGPTPVRAARARAPRRLQAGPRRGRGGAGGRSRRRRLSDAWSPGGTYKTVRARATPAARSRGGREGRPQRASRVDAEPERAGSGPRLFTVPPLPDLPPYGRAELAPICRPPPCAAGGRAPRCRGAQPDGAGAPPRLRRPQPFHQLVPSGVGSRPFAFPRLSIVHSPPGPGAEGRVLLFVLERN